MSIAIVIPQGLFKTTGELLSIIILQFVDVNDPADYRRNLLPYLFYLEEDEAGPDPLQIARQFGIPEERMIVLSRNENPYGPSPRVPEALRNAQLNRYTDSRPFLEALSRYTGCSRESIVTGAGMDEIITTICRLFLMPGDRAFIPVPTYNVYGLATELCGAMPIYQPKAIGNDMVQDVPKGVKMVFLCSPNNPTGEVLTIENVRAILEETDAIVFLDEAYIEFSEKSLIELVSRHDNLVVGRTLSKAFALAGMRLGYALAPSWIAEQYRRVAPMFSISSASLAAGVAALQDLAWMRECTGKIIAERERMKKRISSFLPSQGNFLYLKTHDRSKDVARRLHLRGIIVRDCSIFHGCGEHALRVTVGLPEENERFMDEFERADGP
ncbi:MAG TPA: histidinol-phosphate transaminase [Methanothrix sp.]|nr:histidinol-phosphate transaminase [Methanothrix sp.]